MNVEYIPAFYAAFNDATAIAEVRPSIGDSNAIGVFELKHDLQVFDFTVFSKLDGDRFGQAIAHSRFDFIAQMEDEISNPVVPYEMQREYIAAKIAAEYLREHFDCEAVIYKSSMHKDDNADTRNIVIFNGRIEFCGNPAS